MITDVVLDRRRLRAGETRYLQAYGDDPLVVEIHCFAQKPPPPGYKPCKECGSFRVGSGEAVAVTANARVFSAHGGRLMVSVRDARGDTKEIRLTVSSLDADRGTPALAGA